MYANNLPELSAERRVHQHAKFKVIPSMRSPVNGRPQIWPVSLSRNCAQIRKISTTAQNLINFEGGQGI